MTIVDIAARWSKERSDRPAFTFLADGTTEAGTLTFSQLDERARSIAAFLLSKASPGDRAILVYESGLDFVTALLGCLYAGVIAAPIPAPEAGRLQAAIPRLKSVATDCKARFLLGNAHTHKLLQDERASIEVAPDGWVDTAAVADSTPPAEGLRTPGLEDIAYLQYTSGSTAIPKGVMLTHRNIVEQLRLLQIVLDYNQSSVGITWMPHFHDWGLIEGILLPLYNGTPAYLMSSFSFLKRPAVWLEAFGRYRGTHTQAPNFAYRYAARRVTEQQKARIDLSSLRWAGVAAEFVHPDTAGEFLRTFEACGFKDGMLRPCYGLAEATLLVTAFPVSELPHATNFDKSLLADGIAQPVDKASKSVQAVVCCGRPFPETTVAIVDSETLRELPDGRVGEVWVSSSGVAQGYWQKESESEDTFRARIAGDSSDRRYLRTGDLGVIADGKFYITARKKDLIIIRGQNHFPQDIEWTIQQTHPDLRGDHGAAFSIQDGDEERLCVVQEFERGQFDDAELEAIRDRAAQAVSDQHSIALHGFALIRRGLLPKTSSGKVQRAATRQAFMDGSLKAIKVWNPSAPDAPPPAPSQLPANSQKANDLIEWLREYAARRINSRLIDERRCVPPPVIMDLGNRGVFGLQVPSKYGGLELTHSETMRVYQQLGALDLSLATLIFLHNTNGIRPILHFATPEMQAELLPLLASGRELAGFALSEPEAGSNLGAVQSRAIADGEGFWKVHGTKRWNGTGWTGVISVFARHSGPDGRPRGLTGFIVRQSDPGVRIGEESLTMGMRGIMQNAMHLDGVRVGRDRMLGELGHGMRVVELVLSLGRMATAAITLGGSQRCAQLILRYISRRQIETGLMIENPQVMVRVTELIRRIAVEQELLHQYASQLDAGKPAVNELSMALKLSCTSTLNSAADLLMQLLGGRGYMENNLAPQILRDARALSVGEGANESLIAAIGRGVRFTSAVTDALKGLEPAGELADQVGALMDKGNPAATSAEQIWRDVLLGRAAVDGFFAAAAGTLAGRDSSQTSLVAWAKEQFERSCAAVREGTGGYSEALSPHRIREEIEAYRAAIGDHESKAPDVDFALDPLLRRDFAPPVSSASGDSGRELRQFKEESSSGVDEKKERLRRLLESKAGKGSSTQGPGLD